MNINCRNWFSTFVNLKVYARQKDVVPFYREASVVLNLSNKEQFIETFGLTALEAMVFGLPVIVPTVGGIAEMVEDGVNGWRPIAAIVPRIVEIVAAISAMTMVFWMACIRDPPPCMSPENRLAYSFVEKPVQLPRTLLSVNEKTAMNTIGA